MKGFALPVALFMVALGGALAVSGAFVSRRQLADRRAAAGAGTLDGLAEEWAAGTLADWDSTVSPTTGQWTPLSGAHTEAGRIERWIVRTNSSVYWVVVEVTRPYKPLLRRRLGAAAVVQENRLLLAPGWGWSELP